MAILKSCPGLKVEVIANGIPLREYTNGDLNDPQATITRYVEANTEGTFEVLYQFLDEYVATYGVGAEVRLDGIKVDSSLIRSQNLKGKGGFSASGIESKINGRWYTSKLVFSSFTVGEYIQCARCWHPSNKRNVM